MSTKGHIVRVQVESRAACRETRSRRGPRDGPRAVCDQLLCHAIAHRLELGVVDVDFGVDWGL